MVTKSSREMQKDREKIRPPFGGLKFCQGTHYLPLTFGMIPSSNCDVNTYVFDFMTHVSASLLMLLSAAHPVCLASEKNSCPAFS